MDRRNVVEEVLYEVTRWLQLRGRAIAVAKQRAQELGLWDEVKSWEKKSRETIGDIHAVEAVRLML